MLFRSERWQDAGIILVWIVLDMFAGGSPHQDLSFGVCGFEKDFLGQVQPRLVGDDLGVQARGFEFACHVDSCIVVLFAGRDVGGSSQCFELFLGQPGVGNCQEILVELGLAAEVPISQNMIGKRRNLGRSAEVREGQQGESKSFWE